MIGTEELAERLYERWRLRMDVIAPRREGEPRMIGMQEQPTDDGRLRPRVRWKLLDENRRSVWRAVAEEAGRVLAAAVGTR